MVYSLSLNTFLVLLLSSMVKSDTFTPCFDLIFTKPFYSSSDVKVKQDSTHFANTSPAQANSDVEPAFSCSSVHMNNFSWRWLINFTPCGNYASLNQPLAQK
ncbi:unnamed protein product [Blepharisma stoltei]|uniref:Uncharacterized protein n=1 Tax=Blepharisma stoltei TaxID=1481888 RepID=A0AAU9J067_9CILI|nr:unnamed protein product [Blepharisma stoltei]